MEEKYEVINTKVSPEAYKKIVRICKKTGINQYQMLQTMCECIINYMDDKHNLQPETERVMQLFEHLVGWKDCFNLVDPLTEKEVGEALYFLQAKGKKGARALMVEKPFFDEWKETSNIQQILERVLCLMVPDRYRRLRALAANKDCSSILELLDHLIDFHSEDEDTEEYRRLFEDASRVYGKEMEYGKKRRRSRRRDMENDMFAHNTREEERDGTQ